MNPIQAALFLLFVLPALMIKSLWKMLTKNMTKKEKHRMLWNIPYVLIGILIILIIIFWTHGYR